jgi:hypothetical protein
MSSHICDALWIAHIQSKAFPKLEQIALRRWNSTTGILALTG